MKNVLKAVATVMALTAISMNLQAAFSTGSSNEGRLQISPPSTSEVFLEQIRVNSRLQAAEASFNLSLIAAKRNNLTLAATLIEEAIQINHSNLGYLTFAADIAFLTQNFDKAKQYQAIVLKIVRSELALDDLQVAMVLDQLGAISVKQEHYEEAWSSFQEGLQLRENVLGEKHLLVAVSLNRLAALAIRQQRPTVAESLLKRSLDMAREVSGPRHVNTAVMLSNLADFYQSEARFVEAESLYKEAISIWADSPQASLSKAMGQQSLGRLFLSQRRFDDAREQFEQVLLLLKQNYALDHPYIQQAIRNLASVDAERDSNAKKKHMYEELVRELSFKLPQSKLRTANNTLPLSGPRTASF